MREDPKLEPSNAEAILVDLWKKAISGDPDCINAVRTIIYRMPSRQFFSVFKNYEDN